MNLLSNGGIITVVCAVDITFSEDVLGIIWGYPANGFDLLKDASLLLSMSNGLRNMVLLPRTEK
ncbi:hypothetical protein H5410_050416 [Solanum commersonii]|uniref:Uncharacterized protein n=1 Tax=Solanum commersonii TaxID=4109 RepID=A0A9J5WX04_SOLCO|nr:hypothetical protein H5410_050416 [Solanum commersonii]